MTILKPVQVNSFIERLAEHALATGIKDWELANQIKKRYLEIALDMNGGNQTVTARLLGMHRNSISRLMDAYGIERKGYMANRGNRRKVML